MKTTTKLISLLILLALTFSNWGVTSVRGSSGILHVKSEATGAGDCTSWENACTLQTALADAVNGDYIWVMAGTHKPTTGTDRTATFQLKSGVAVLGGFNGTETDLEADKRDPAANLTILSGEIGAADVQADNSYHVVTGSDNATLDGFTITAGYASGDSPNNSGGGMYNVASSPTLTNIIFSNNYVVYSDGMYDNSSNPTLTEDTFSGNFVYSSVDRFGGGMYNDTSNPTLTNVTFSGNLVYAGRDGFGGGMYNYASNPTLTNVTFNRNGVGAGEDAYGGGMYNSASNPTLTNVTFNDNGVDSEISNSFGGGMYNDSSNPLLIGVTFSGNGASAGHHNGTTGGGMDNYSSSPTLINVTFSDNWASSGGGMSNSGGSPILTNVTFSGNSAAWYGGGMSTSYSSPTLTNVTFSDNWAGSGGGMRNYSSSPTLTNITFSGNSADRYGGGMYNDSGSPILMNVTLSGNSAALMGGGMYNKSNSDPQINDTIFWGNTAPTPAEAQIYNEDSTPILDYDVIQDGCPGGSTCTHILSANPRLGALKNYGGFTQTIPLLTSSPAIDAGNDATCPATDQRGVARPQRAHCDIGAYEVRATETLTFNSVGAQDGWILEAGEDNNVGGTMNATAATLRLGDDARNQQYRVILSFATASLPNTAIITKVTLRLNRLSTLPVDTNPIRLLRGMMVEIYKGFFGTSADLQLADFQAPVDKTIGPFQPVWEADGWYTLTLNSTTYRFINKFATNDGLTQIRLRFNLEDNNNTTANILNLASGNNAVAAKRPVLMIEYYVP